MNIHRILKEIALWLALTAPCLLPAHAMEFRIFYQPELKINVLIGEGEIRAGDAQRFLALAPRADRDAEGHITLVLDSPGGSVNAAFALVDAMDRVGVFTVVPDNALCASACASILFASGVRREVIGTGRLGFHSCYSYVNGQTTNSSFCNERIAQNAMSRGLSHASVSLFVKDYGAQSMAWVDRSIACTMLIGMCRPTLRHKGSGARSTVGPSFDCANATTLVERLICDNGELSKMDARMSIAYFTFRSRTEDRRQHLAEQRAWLKNDRDRCQTIPCLNLSYQRRINELEILLSADR